MTKKAKSAIARNVKPLKSGLYITWLKIGWSTSLGCFLPQSIRVTESRQTPVMSNVPITRHILIMTNRQSGKTCESLTLLSGQTAFFFSPSSSGSNMTSMYGLSGHCGFGGGGGTTVEASDDTDSVSVSFLLFLLPA